MPRIDGFCVCVCVHSMCSVVCLQSRCLQACPYVTSPVSWSAAKMSMDGRWKWMGTGLSQNTALPDTPTSQLYSAHPSKPSPFCLIKDPCLAILGTPRPQITKRLHLQDKPGRNGQGTPRVVCWKGCWEHSDHTYSIKPYMSLLSSPGSRCSRHLINTCAVINFHCLDSEIRSEERSLSEAQFPEDFWE